MARESNYVPNIFSDISSVKSFHFSRQMSKFQALPKMVKVKNRVRNISAVIQSVVHCVITEFLVARLAD